MDPDTWRALMASASDLPAAIPTATATVFITVYAPMPMPTPRPVRINNINVIPASYPPRGVRPNLINPPSDAWVLRATCYPLLAVTWLAVLLRIYTRKCLTPSRRMGLSDYLAVLAVGFASMSTITAEIQTHFGLGVHQWNVRLNVFSPNFLFLLVVSQETYIISMFCIKLSVLFFYKGFLTIGRYYRLAWTLVLLIVTSYSLTAMFLVVLACEPVDALWTISLLPQAKCISIPLMLFSVGTLNAATDFGLLFLALPIVWKLQVSRQQKVGIGVLFLLGSYAGFVSIWRLVLLPPKPPRPLPRGGGGPDMTYGTLRATIWSLVEIYSAIICACLVTLRPLFRKLFKRVDGDDTYDDQGTFNMPKQPKEKEWKFQMPITIRSCVKR